MKMGDTTYFENGLEYYKSNDRRVWPERHRERPEMKTGKRKGPLREDSFVLGMLDHLDRAEVMNRPSLGEHSAKAKDGDAFSALMFAAWLTEYAAGWALDHEIGLAINNRKFVPLLPGQTKKLPEYQEIRTAVDSHEHELDGGAFADYNSDDPILARRVAINILAPIYRHLKLPMALIEALKALDTGEVLPILQPVSTTDKVRYRESHFQLEAVAFVEYWTVRKGKKHQALKMVAEAFGVPADTLRGWKSRLRVKLGTLEVNAAVSRAINCANSLEREERKKNAGDPLAHPESFDWAIGPYSYIAVGKKYREFLGFNSAQ
jgi:hypothetical protein